MTVPGARHGDADAVAAAEELDLALSRLQWAESCTCVRTNEQSEALRWHAAQVRAAGRRDAEPGAEAGPVPSTVLP